MDHLDKAILAAGIAGFCLGCLVTIALTRWAMRGVVRDYGE